MVGDDAADSEEESDDESEDESDDEPSDDEIETGIHEEFKIVSTGQCDNDDEDNSAASKKPSLPYKNEISHKLNRNPQLAKNNKIIAAIDAGQRYPIAIAAKARDASSFLSYKVRKENLYQFENEECRKLEYMKAEQPEVLAAEQQLARTGSKNSYNADSFIDGYFKDWLAVHRKLYDFYGQRQIRNMRYHKCWARKKLYDAHCTTILDMLGLKPNSKITNPGEVILVVEDDMIGVKHKGRRPSKHAVFWRYFLRKVSCY